MVSQPRLLFLSHRVPFPPHNGAAIRTYNILRLLAREFEIHGLCFDRRDSALAGMPLTERIAGLSPFGAFETFPIPQDGNRLRFTFDHGRSVATGRPYTWYIHGARVVRERLRQLLRSRSFDLVHVDSLDLVALLPELRGLPVALTHHNVESALLRRRAERERNPAAAGYLRLQAGLLARAEARWLPRVALNIAVSPADAADFRRMAQGARVEVIPNGVDTTYFAPSAGSTSGCVFVGGTSWYPNLDGLQWFAAEVLPRLRAHGLEGEVTWVGRATDAELAHYNSMPGLHLTGYVDDIRPYVHSAACFIAPLRVGGGTRLKLLDAWAMGKAIVSTTRGAEGLNTRDGENILLADTPDGFATSVMRVLRDENLRRALEQAGRETVEQSYSWEVLGERIQALYLPLVGRRPASTVG